MLLQGPFVEQRQSLLLFQNLPAKCKEKSEYVLALMSENLGLFGVSHLYDVDKY